METITEEQFYEQFELIPNHIDNNASFSGDMFETYGEELEFVRELAKQKRVVTIIEGDEGMHYTSGMHLVNRIGYLITKNPITFEFEAKID
jgi:hypothetical protein